MSHTNHVAGVPGMDETLPDVHLIIGGEKRNLVFDFNAICLVQKHTGLNLLKQIVSEPDALSLRALLWAALLKGNPKLTLEEVGTWVTIKNVPVIHEALVMAWFGSVAPEESEGEPGEEEAQTTTV